MRKHTHKWYRWTDSMSRGWQFRAAKCCLFRFEVRKKARTEKR